MDETGPTNGGRSPRGPSVVPDTFQLAAWSCIRFIPSELLVYFSPSLFCMSLVSCQLKYRTSRVRCPERRDQTLKFETNMAESSSSSESSKHTSQEKEEECTEVMVVVVHMMNGDDITLI